MIVELNGFVCHGNIGAKARSLVDLHRNGFKVPTSIALDTKEFINITKSIKDKINLLLDRINFDNIEIISKQIKMLFENVHLSETICEEIIKLLHDDEVYILRCSIEGVDEAYAYAGLFPKRMKINKENIFDNIIECYKSLYSYNSLYYMLVNNIDYSNIATAIIIQREIKTDILGYVTTMNPVTLNGNELTIDIENNNLHDKYYFDLSSDKFLNDVSYNIISKSKIEETIELVKNIQSNLGYPVEIELAYTKNNIYVIQTREIQSILYENENSIWRKKNMSCKQFMYSLVSENYSSIISKYYEDLKLNSNEKFVSLVFNGCYYNAVNISKIIDSLVDYSDEYLTNKLGITYKIERKNNIKKKLNRFKNRKYVNHKIELNEENIETLKKDLHEKYSDYCHHMSKVSAKDIERIWLKLVIDDYNALYSKYLDLKIIVLIEKNRLYKQLKSYLEISEFDELINIKEESYKYKVDKEYNELVKCIKNDEEAYRYWFSSSALKILKNYNENSTEYYHKEFRHFIDNYGYLSYFKFDLSESFYVEDVEDVIRDIKKQLASFERIEDNELERNSIIKKLQDSMMDKTYDKYMKLINRLQKLIINLSELKDYVLRFNFVVKRYSKMLAKLYVKKNILENESDIWYLDINSIYDYIDGEIDGAKLNEIMLKNKLYYNSYRNFHSIQSLGYIHTDFDNYDYIGTGLTTDVVIGKVRMIKSLKELSTLKTDDILVTKSINNNLLFQLPKIRGIIISDQNISNSTKTTLRELRIPCIILDNCSKKMIDGSIIKFDGATGRVKKVRKQ